MNATFKDGVLEINGTSTKVASWEEARSLLVKGRVHKDPDLQAKRALERNIKAYFSDEKTPEEEST